MKKLFPLTHPKIQPARLVDSIRGEMNKYIKRERNKKRPDGIDFWDFDCKFGDTEKYAKSCHLAEIDKNINHAEERELNSFYIEVIAIPGTRQKKPNLKTKT